METQTVKQTLKNPFGHGTEASDEHNSSEEQESIADDGDNDGDDSDEDEDKDGDSSSARIVQMMKTKMTVYGVA